MNEQTDKLIRELAEQFGTTANHLWAVLVHQARISSAINLASLVFCAVVLWWSFRLIQKKTTPPLATEADQYPRAEWDGDAEPLVWTLWCVLFLITLVVGLLSIADIAAGLFNPEYWALKTILSK